MIEKFEIFAIRVKIATSSSCSSESRKNFEKGKQTGSSTISRLYYCQGFVKIFPVVAEIACLVPKHLNS